MPDLAKMQKLWFLISNFFFVNFSKWCFFGSLFIQWSTRKQMQFILTFYFLMDINPLWNRTRNLIPRHFCGIQASQKFWPRFYCHIPLGFDLGFRMTKIRFSIFTSFRTVAFRPKNIKTFFACGKFSAVISNLIFLFLYNIKSNATRVHQNTDLFY